jgi:hypothetical protein
VIHYHGLPLTPVADMLRAMRGHHTMVSFADPRQIEEATEVCQSVVLDCGAFSAWQGGQKYDFAGYSKWVGHWLRHPAVDWCIIPDVIDGTVEENDDLVCGWIYNKAQSVPVYHLHEPLQRLHWLTDLYPRVALGSSGEFSEPGTPRWWDRMRDVMRVACRKDGMPWGKLHGLRMLDPTIFSHLPLASADSCNVARNIGLDTKWNGPYAPSNKATRAIVMIDRIEAHASARRWSIESAGVQQNMELLG